jgi:hypothetical protein
MASGYSTGVDPKGIARKPERRTSHRWIGAAGSADILAQSPTAGELAEVGAPYSGPSKLTVFLEAD